MTETPGAIIMWAAHLQELLRRVGAGEDPDLVFIEEIANADGGPGSVRRWLDDAESQESL
jgi:hypothetical protein